MIDENCVSMTSTAHTLINARMSYGTVTTLSMHLGISKASVSRPYTDFTIIAWVLLGMSVCCAGVGTEKASGKVLESRAHRLLRPHMAARRFST